MDVELNLHSDVVSDAALEEPISVAPETTLREVLLLMKDQEQGSLLICRDAELIGIFTERDALRIMAKSDSFDDPVEDHMHSPVMTVQSDDVMATVITRMASGGVRRLPVLDENRRPLGVLKASGVLNYLVEHFPQAVYNLPPDPDSVPQDREGP
ncbi:MAG: CBS domain-containing protein [Planctomycetales bacterium]